MNTSQLVSEWGNLLSERETDVVGAYLVTRNITATAAMAGCSAQTVSNLLKEPKVITALRLAEKETRENARVTAEEIIVDLRIIRDMCLGRIPVPVQTKTPNGAVTEYVYKFDASGANKAVENMGRVLGMFTDKKEISIPVSDDQLKRKLEDLLGITVDGELVAQGSFGTLEQIAEEEIASSIVKVADASMVPAGGLFDDWD